MNYAEFFYQNCTSQLTEDDEKCFAETSTTMNYLEDNAVSDKDILKVLFDCSGKKVIRKNDLPAFLWQGSLIDRNKFYFHHTLQIVPDSGEFYIEMKIQFTLQDLLNYFVETLKIELVNERKLLAQLKSLLEEYSHLKFVEPLDFVLTLIDNASWKNLKIFEPFDLNNFDICGRYFRTFARKNQQSRGLWLKQGNFQVVIHNK